MDSPAELARRDAANLATTIDEVVAARPNIVRRAPNEKELQDWIDQSKQLEGVEHETGDVDVLGVPKEI